MTDRMYLAFQECLEMSGRGASLKECLDRFPQYAGELEPLLVAARNSAGSSGPVMPAEMRSRLRGWVLSEWDRQQQPRRQRWIFSLFSSRWAMAAATAVVMVVVLAGGAGTAAAQDALPGTTLYPVKRLEEEARLWITRSPEVKVVRYGDLVRERAQELRMLAGRGDSEAASVAVGHMEGHIRDVSLLLNRLHRWTRPSRPKSCQWPTWSWSFGQPLRMLCPVRTPLPVRSRIPCGRLPPMPILACGTLFVPSNRPASGSMMPWARLGVVPPSLAAVSRVLFVLNNQHAAPRGCLKRAQAGVIIPE